MADPIDDVFALQFLSTIGGQKVANTFHVRQNPTAGAVDAAHLVALLASTGMDSLVTAYRALIPTVSNTLDAVVARLVPDPLNPDEPRAEAVRSVGLAGTFSTAIDAPLEVCLVVTLGTDLAGRRYRGRFFTPPIASASTISGENITAGTYWTNLAAFLTELAKTMYPSGASHYGGAWNDNDLVVYSKRARALDVGPYYARVTAATRRQRLHWLRSRGPRT